MKWFVTDTRGSLAHFHCKLERGTMHMKINVKPKNVTSNYQIQYIYFKIVLYCRLLSIHPFSSVLSGVLGSCLSRDVQTSLQLLLGMCYCMCNISIIAVSVYRNFIVIMSLISRIASNYGVPRGPQICLCIVFVLRFTVHIWGMTEKQNNLIN